jgi:hypothetical protein
MRSDKRVISCSSVSLHTSYTLAVKICSRYQMPSAVARSHILSEVVLLRAGVATICAPSALLVRLLCTRPTAPHPTLAVRLHAAADAGCRHFGCMLGVKAVQQELARRRLAATTFNLPMLKELSSERSIRFCGNGAVCTSTCLVLFYHTIRFPMTDGGVSLDPSVSLIRPRIAPLCIVVSFFSWLSHREMFSIRPRNLKLQDQSRVSEVFPRCWRDRRIRSCPK